MKIKVYSLASDGDDGTRATVFGTESELHAAMREAIEEDIDGDVTENAGAIRLLLEAGDIKAAWSDWQELITPKFFRYEKGEHEIKVELPQVDAALSLLETIAQYFDDSEMTVLSRSIDESAFVEVLKNTIKSLSPAPTVSA